MSHKHKLLNGLVVFCLIFSMGIARKPLSVSASIPSDPNAVNTTIAHKEQNNRTNINSGEISSSYVNNQTTPDYVPGELIVKFQPAAADAMHRYRTRAGQIRIGLSSVDALNRRYHVTGMERVFPEVERPVSGAMVRIDGQERPLPDLSAVYRLRVEIDTDILAAARSYAADPHVVYAEPNYIAEIDATPDDTYYAQQWGLTKIDAPAAWDAQTGALGIVIAVIDTGVDMDHPDLGGKIWNNPGETLDGVDNDGNGLIDDLHGYDWVNGDADPQDDNGHGTHCAGISAAETDNAQGVAGVCWNCSVMPLKAFQSSGRGSYADIAAAINYAANKGAHVINMSFGSYADSQVVKDALENAYGTAVLVASAGNDNTSATHYPAAYSWVMGVAATDGADKKAGFSNYGDWVDVSAPGVNIYSTLFDDTYAGWSGTSMAAPFVSGLAALLVAEHPTWSKELIRGQLYQSTDNIDALNPSYAGKLGTGRINAGTAFTLAPTPDIHYQSNVVGDGTGDGDGVVDAGESITLTVTLKNYWENATNVTATLSTLDSWTTIDDASASFGNISAYASMDNQSNPFEFSVDSSTPNNHDITFQLDIYAEGGYHSTDSFYLTVQRGTEVGGVIDTNTIWTSDREYLITNNILVNTGVTLTIQPGTVIRFDAQADRYIRVAGTLLALGTATHPIVFTANSLTPQIGMWYYIDLMNNSIAQFSYCIVEYSNEGIRALGVPALLNIENSILQNNYNGIQIVNRLGTATIKRNLMIDNWDTGITGLRPNDSILLEHNLITRNGIYKPDPWPNDSGIYVYEPLSENYTIRHNIFFGNAYDVGASLGIGELDFSSNYWGTTDISVINEQIYDFYDDFARFRVIFTPTLKFPPNEAPPFLRSNSLTTDNQSGSLQLPGDPVSNETMTTTLDFSAPMTTTTEPKLTFGVDEPYTQHRIENGQWISPTRWVGSYEVDVTTGDGINTFRVADARSADGFFTIPTDTRFQFTIQTAGTEAMLLQASVNYGKVSLSWPESDIPDLAGYNVYRSPLTNTNYTDTPLNDILLTSPGYTDTNVTNGVLYYYKYTVVDTGFGESGYSNEASVTPDDPTPPTAPVVLDDGMCTSSTSALHASWSAEDPESGIAEYEYGIGAAPGTVNVVNWTSVGTATQVTKSGLNLTPGITYYFTVRTKNGVGQWSEAGNSDGILIDLSCNMSPNIPSNPDPEDNAVGVPITQTLRWQGGDPDGDPVTYTVALGNLSPPPVIATDITTTTYTPRLLSPRTTYYWVITATDGINTVNGLTWRFTTRGQIYGVDLAPNHTGAAQPGDTVTYPHIITNTGNYTDTFTLQAVSSQSWTVELLGGDYPMGTVLLPLQLGAGLTATLQVSLTVPTTAISGTVDQTVITATSVLSPAISVVVIDTTTIVTEPPPAPQVDFVGNPRSGDVPLTVQFTSTVTGTVTAYGWRFGDGGLADTPNPTHTYESAGNFGVTLVVIGPGGTANVSKPGHITVNAPPGAPTATFSADVISGTAPLTVTFTVVTSGTVEHWLWSFGDGGTAFTGPVVSHTYTTSGTFDVSLTVSNTQGSFTVNEPSYIVVTITEPPPPVPQVDFVGNPRSGDVPLTVQFTSTVTGTVTTYDWSFGDSGIADTFNPTHTYASAGNFGVTLVVTGPGGTSNVSKPGYITVNPAPGAPTATFSADVVSGTAPLTVTFTAVTSGTVEHWQWDFGDSGTAFTGPVVSHTYTTSGTFDVSLTVSNTHGSFIVSEPDCITIKTKSEDSHLIYLPLVLRNTPQVFVKLRRVA